MKSPTQSQSGRLGLVQGLIEAALGESDDLPARLETAFPALTLAPVDVARVTSRYLGEPETPGLGGTGVAVWHDSALLVAAAEQRPDVSLDGGAAMPMQAIRGTRYWMRLEHVTAGELHSCRFGISGSWGPGLDFPGYTDQSYELAGVRPGEIVASRTVHSEIYPNASTNYWLYANAGIDEGRGAPLMIWLDGHVCLDAVDQFGMRMQVVTDNLAHLGLIPPMVHVLVAPSSPGEPLATRFDGEDQANAMRSLQYDEVSDRYGRHLLDEVLPDAGRLVKLRADAYSRGASGGSSGGVCAFKLGWFHDHEFSRVHSVIGSFTGLQWDPDSDLPGGFMYANLVRREQRRNIRVWLSDGSNDFEVGPEGRRDFFIAGSWPLNNIMLANALKLAGYDFRFRFGNGYHTGGQQSLDLPESLAWLWHGYDPERTEERFEQAAAEREQPPFRVQITNRDT